MLAVFDFDGTLADTQTIMLDIYNRLALRHHLQPLTTETLEAMRALPAREIIRRLRLNPLQIFLIFRAARKLLNQRMNEVDFPCPGVGEALARLGRIPQLRLGILTSNTRANADKFLRLRSCHSFQFIHTSATLWSKARSLRRIRKAYGLPGEPLLYIGDEIRDIEAARRAGVLVAAVGWGYNAPHVLQQMKPDLFVQKPEELVAGVKRFGDLQS